MATRSPDGVKEPADLRIDLVVADTEPEEVDELTIRLRRELLELEVERVETAPSGEPPAGSRAFEVLALGGLVVTLARDAGALKGVVRTLQSWLARDQRRSVKLELDGDALEVTGVSSQEQERLIAAWLARHSAV